ncbi:uncharacterized protein LOC111711342 [Eurytemora carolleeae]|uniref:uncharacterized protein LOC111711342 n=1 Tax=Eurytemora carolleeae TaxID=1294199 RepID=UPI000C779AF4|nr:uncharacterized protein LOC111711342 [Eurytemora carolleeae]|eukprot:XP_023341446.1 uncharacterized protein LOC111711342 [Eurytemora affinis]
MNVTPQLEFYVNNKKAKHKDEMQVRRLLDAGNEKHSKNKLRAFEYQLEDNGGLLGTSLALEVRITRNHLNSNNKVRFTCRATAANGIYLEETSVDVGVRAQDLLFYSSSTLISPTISLLILSFIHNILQ